MSDAVINGLAGAGGGIIAQLITYPLQTVRHAPATNLCLGLPALWCTEISAAQVNARQQTERDPTKPAFKDGAARQIYLVRISLAPPRLLPSFSV